MADALLDELKNRHQAATERLAETAQTFQHAQQAHSTATANLARAQQAYTVAQQQHNAWTVALQTVATEEAARQQAAEQNQLQLPSTSIIESPVVAEAIEAPEPVNKTDVIRALLKMHPAGMTPMEIWSHVEDRFKHRAYLYSVLKRLTDREELYMKRGKYALKVRPEVSQTALLQ